MRVFSPLRCVLLALSFARLCPAADNADAVRAMQAAREGAAAMETKDFSTAVGKLEASVELRPDFPQLLLDLAQAQVGAERLDDAVVTLQRYAKLGLHSAIDKADEYAPLRSRKDFLAVAKQVAANLHPKGKGEIGFTLRDVTGLIEGIAWREKSGEFYFSDVHHRTVWTRNKDGTLKRFTPEGDELLGVFGLAVDEANGILWAATAAVPAMRGYSPELAGTAALAEIDLQTGTVRRSIPVPRIASSEATHVLSDVALASDGTVYVVDRGMPVVWRLPPGGQALERFAESPEFFGLQGIAVLPSGAALLADQVNGILRLDLSRGSVVRLDAPPDTTLIEIKGLATAADGRVLALQTDLRPSRVLSLELDPSAESVSGVTVVESGHLAMGVPSLGCIGTDGDLFFIGNAGWSRFSDSDAQATPPRQVPIFRSKLAGPKK
ncbi:MAG: tetratricopeptide repeat protein [Opitutaceae bacterium]